MNEIPYHFRDLAEMVGNFFICSPFRRASLRFKRRLAGDVILYYDRRKNRICENDGVEIP